MSNQEKTIEQLWYTWSRIGLDRLTAGFRIRAASAGLEDIRSQRVQNLDSCFFYFLPRDRDRPIAVGIAPIDLSFNVIKGERVLLQKVYTGQDDYGRYGAYFIHLLLNLPANFSARDAIALWRSDFWQCNDVPASVQSKLLEKVSLEELQDKKKKKQPNTNLFPFLCSVIEAYLSKNLNAEKSHTPPPQLAIAASDEDIAQLIIGLTQGLPIQLIQNLTFSTYENALEQAKTEIVGRCWYTRRKGNQHFPEELLPENNKKETEQLLPVSRQHMLLLNFYTDQWRTALEGHSLVVTDSRIKECALSVAQYVFQGNTEYQEFLESIATVPALTIEQFLARYERHMRAALNPTREDIEDALSSLLSGVHPDFEIAINRLSRPSYQKKFLELVLLEYGWWNGWRDKVIKLQQKNRLVLDVSNVLLQIAHKVLDSVISTVEAWVSGGSATAKQDPGEIFKRLVDVMSCITPPTEVDSVWQRCAEELGQIEHVAFFFRKYMFLYGNILSLFSMVFVKKGKHEFNSEFVAPLLRVISWQEYGMLLRMQLPLEWSAQITHWLIFEARERYPLSHEIVRELALQYRQELARVVRGLAQQEQKGSWSVVLAFFESLAQNNYSDIMQLCLILLSSPMGEYDGAELILQRANIQPTELVPFLERSGPQQLPLGFNNKETQALLLLFSELGRSNPQQKMRVLFSWLSAKPIEKWLGTASDGVANFDILLERACLTTTEAKSFFYRYGKKYVSLFSASSTQLLTLFLSYARLPEQGRFFDLEIWLACSITPRILDQLLFGMKLNLEEKVNFLLKYGEYYLTKYPDLEIVLNYVDDFIRYLSEVDLANLSLQKLMTIEQFLRFCYVCVHTRQPVILRLRAQLSSQLFADWLWIVKMLREPTFFAAHTEGVVGGIRRLIFYQQIRAPGYEYLLEVMAARSAQMAPKQLASTLEMLQKNLSIRDLVYLLFELAVEANKSVRERFSTKGPLTYIQAVVHLQSIFQKEDQQLFWSSWLETLFTSVDDKKINWRGEQEWPEEIKLWRENRAFQVEPHIFWLDRPYIWSERYQALNRVRRALKSNRQPSLLHLALDSMTTLMYYGEKPWTQEEYTTLQGIWDTIQPQRLAWILEMASNKAQATQSKVVAQKVSRWKRTKALLALEDMLARKNSCRIVRVAMQYEAILKLCPEEINESWRMQMQLACQFFLAWQVVQRERTRLNEQKLLEIAENMELCRKEKKPTPLFTEHEWMRLEEIKRKREREQILYGKVSSGQEAVKRLSAALERSVAPQSQVALASTSASKSVWQKLRTWFTE